MGAQNQMGLGIFRANVHLDKGHRATWAQGLIGLGTFWATEQGTVGALNSWSIETNWHWNIFGANGATSNWIICTNRFQVIWKE